MKTKQIEKNELTERVNSDESQKVWSILCDRQMAQIEENGCEEFKMGLRTIKFSKNKMPVPHEINHILRQTTGWEIFPVKGIIDDDTFFDCLSDKKFPVTDWIRKLHELDYLEEPDLFHDIFGHVPLLSNPSFAKFLEGLGHIGKKHSNDPVAIHLLSRFYWYTVEFGLIRERGDLKIYGAGILSSPGETTYSLGREPMHFEYHVEQILSTPYCKEKFQDRYFIINSFQQVYNSLQEVEECVDALLSKRMIFES